jgi:chromodomain-helicase-DNA-binding protein 4
MQMGKKKLVLDHLIVQKMDKKDEGEDVQSILTYGAKALFEEDQNAKDVFCRSSLLHKIGRT